MTVPSDLITVGLYPGDAGWAAAAAIGGRIVAAVDAPRGRHGDDAEACRALLRTVLSLAGVRPADVDRLVVVSSGERSRQIGDAPAVVWDGVPPKTTLLCSDVAEAAQLRGQAVAMALVLHDDRQLEARLCTTGDGRSPAGETLRDAQGVNAAAALVADALSAEGARALLALERIAAARPRAMTPPAGHDGAVPFDVQRARTLVAQAQASCGELGDADSRHVAVQTARASLAMTALDAVADTLAAALRSQAGNGGIGATGTAFATSAFADRLKCRLPSLEIAPVVDARGAALGAALHPHAQPAPLAHVALGIDIDESDVKSTLENCRLDYVYEPDWAKLLQRVSTLLSTGALVGWCQGRRDFGSRTFGSRSVLADPSKRYARENVNVFLRRGDVHAPVPVSILDDTWDIGHEAATGDLSRHCAGVVDHHGRLLVQRQPVGVAPHLAELIRMHHARTDVPGLVNVPLAERADWLVDTPRDAVREAFSSAVDVLVLGRFLVSKDYWLIRAR